MAKKNYRRKQKRVSVAIPIVVGLLLIAAAVLSVSAGRPAGNTKSLASVAPASVSFAAPELSLQNINGNVESLTDYQDDVVLVNNWATWCPPCKAEMPELSAYYNAHHDAGFTIIAIEAGDPLDAVSQFVQNYGLKFPVWLDPDGAAIKAFQNGTLPSSYVIDRSGTVRFAWTGSVNREMLEKYVTPLVNEN